MEKDLRALIVAGVPALKSVSWITRPQASQFPAATLQTITAPVARTFEGRTDLANSIVQIDIWATSYAAAKSAARAMVPALEEAGEQGGTQFYKIFVEEGREGAEDVPSIGKIYRITLEAAIWWQD